MFLWEHVFKLVLMNNKPRREKIMLTRKPAVQMKLRTVHNYHVLCTVWKNNCKNLLSCYKISSYKDYNIPGAAPHLCTAVCYVFLVFYVFTSVAPTLFKIVGTALLQSWSHDMRDCCVTSRLVFKVAVSHSSSCQFYERGKTVFLSQQLTKSSSCRAAL